MTTRLTPICPLCPGRGVPLGQLGLLRWFRCRDCGIDFNKRVRPKPAPAPAAATPPANAQRSNP